MCGRYSQQVKEESLQRAFEFLKSEFELAPRYNVAPSQEAPVVVAEEDGRRLRLFRWGLIPVWAKDMAIGNKMINARADTIMDKPSYKRPFQKHRCLVVADGFYEWAHPAGAKKGIPYRVTLKSREPFAFAGIWDRWKKPDGKEVRSFAIVTTDGAPSLRHIHDRMPVILDPKEYALWLDPKADAQRLLALLNPLGDEKLEAYRVSELVNKPANDVPACLEKVSAPQGELWDEEPWVGP